MQFRHKQFEASCVVALESRIDSYRPQKRGFEPPGTVAHAIQFYNSGAKRILVRVSTR